jgi:hypothetical protein
MNFAVGGTGGPTSTHTRGVPPTRVNLNYVAASPKLAFIGETSLVVLPKRPGGRTERAGTARHTPLVSPCHLS